MYKKREYDVSVIVPVYNAEKYIRQCIESILNQDKDNLEIIIVNDGCTDSTPAILRKLEDKHDNIHVICQENKGLAAARIAGLSNATGRYVGWVDADDFVVPEMYDTLYKLAEENHADYVYCDYEFYPEKVATKEKWFKEFHGERDWNYIDRNTQCWNTLSLRELLMRIDLCDSYLKFEEYAWISVMLNAEKVVSTNEVLYYYRVGNETMSGGSYKGKLAHFQRGAELSSKLKELLNGTGYEQKLAEYFDYRYIYTLLQLQIVSAINNSVRVYEDAGKELKRMRFRENSYTKSILDENHGKLKSFVIRSIIPSSFFMAKRVTKAVFG